MSIVAKRSPISSTAELLYTVSGCIVRDVWLLTLVVRTACIAWYAMHAGVWNSAIGERDGVGGVCMQNYTVY